jgi:hypothetical protein
MLEQAVLSARKHIKTLADLNAAIAADPAFSSPTGSVLAVSSQGVPGELLLLQVGVRIEQATTQ